MEAQFGQYRLVGFLGKSPYAEVLLAVRSDAVGHESPVVVKRLPRDVAFQPEFVDMLNDEARLARRLVHPNIVRSLDYGEVDGQYYFAMEYLEGQPLSRLTSRGARMADVFTLDMHLRIVADVLAGLEYAHDATDDSGQPLRVVHRDLTPSNVFITYDDGCVKILDFGIAKAAGRETETVTGLVKGKVTYMPPEQAVGHQVDRRADIFPIGVMLWEAATRRRLWKGLDDVTIVGKLVAGQVPLSPREVSPQVPEAIDAICRRALAPDPAARYASAGALRRDLEAFLEGTRKPTSAEIGALLSEMFSVERRETRRLVEQARADRGAGSSLRPLVLSPESGSSPSMPSGGRTPTDVARTPAEGLVATPREVRIDSITSLKRGDSKAQHPRPSPMLLAIGGAVVVLGAAIAGVQARRSLDDAPTVAPTPPRPSAVAAAGPTAAPTARTLSLRAQPASARFSVDGGPWLENPHDGPVAVDARDHSIRIEAPGHHPKTVSVTFDKDVVLYVALEPDPRARPGDPR